MAALAPRAQKDFLFTQLLAPLPIDSIGVATLMMMTDSSGQVRELSAHLESVREEEKARIAREVHDELGQILTVLKLETSMCEMAYAQLDPGLHERLNSMKKLIAQLFQLDRKSTRLNSSHYQQSRMPSSA